MQATISRQNHFQNLISLIVPILIICYYAFNSLPNEHIGSTSFIPKNSLEENKSVAFETSVSHLRAAVLMDVDAVQINGLLFEVENSLGSFRNRKKAKLVIEKVYKNLLSGDKKMAVYLINQLPTLLLSE